MCRLSIFLLMSAVGLAQQSGFEGAATDALTHEPLSGAMLRSRKLHVRGGKRP